MHLALLGWCLVFKLQVLIQIKIQIPKSRSNLAYLVVRLFWGYFHENYGKISALLTFT